MPRFQIFLVLTDHGPAWDRGVFRPNDTDFLIRARQSLRTAIVDPTETVSLEFTFMGGYQYRTADYGSVFLQDPFVLLEEGLRHAQSESEQLSVRAQLSSISMWGSAPRPPLVTVEPEPEPEVYRPERWERADVL